MPFLVMFFLHYPVPNNSRNDHSNVPDLGEDEKQNYNDRLSSASKAMIRQLKYLQALDAAEDEEVDPSSYYGYDKDLWSVANVLGHC